jgi:hypothetical protein
MAVDVSKIPNNNKFDPVRVAILNLQRQIEDTGAEIGNGTLTINTSSPLTGTGTFTANQTGPTTINIGIDGAEYLTNITHDTVNQKLVVTRGDATTFDINLSQYIDDTNLARLVSGTVNSTTGIATFTRDDATTFTVDFSGFLEDDTLDSVTTRNNATTNTISVGGIDVSYVDADSKIRLESGSFTDSNDRYEILATGDVMFLQYWDNDQGNGTSLQKPILGLEWGGAANNEVTVFGDLRFKSGNVASPTVDSVIIDMDVVNGEVNLTNLNDGTFAGDLTADTVTATTTLTVGTTDVYNALPTGIGFETTDNRLKFKINTNGGFLTANAIDDIVLSDAMSADYIPYVSAAGGDGSATNTNAVLSESWLKVNGSTLELDWVIDGSPGVYTAHDIKMRSDGGGFNKYYESTYAASYLQFLHYNSSSDIDIAKIGGTTTGRIRINDTYSLPAGDGSSGQVLTTNGSGDLSWADASGGGDLTLQDVTDNGATTTNAIVVNGNIQSLSQIRAGGWYNVETGSEGDLAFEIGVSGGEAYALSYNRATSSYGDMNFAAVNFNFDERGGTTTIEGNEIWHAGNDDVFTLDYVTDHGNTTSNAITIGGGTKVTSSETTLTRLYVENTGNAEYGSGIFMEVKNAGTRVGSTTMRIDRTGKFQVFNGGASEALNFQIDENGDASFTNKVSATDLKIESSSGDSIRIGDGFGSGGTATIHNYQQDLYLQYGNGSSTTNLHIGGGGTQADLRLDTGKGLIKMNRDGKSGNAIDIDHVENSNWAYVFRTSSVGNDNDSGFWVNADGTPDMRLRSTGGTVTALIDSSGTSYINGGNLAIGATSSASKLTVASGTPTGAQAVNANTVVAIDSAANQYLEFRTTAASVGIMQGMLFTDNGLNAFIGYKEYTGGTAGTYGEALHLAYRNFSASDVNNGIYFGTSASPQNGVSNVQMFIKGNGMVGIGTDAPSQISSGVPTLTIDNPNSSILSGGFVYQSNGTNQAYHYWESSYLVHQVQGSGGHTFNQGASVLMRVKGDGNVGINTSNPLNKLSVVARNDSGYYQNNSSTVVIQDYFPTLLIAHDANDTDHYSELRLGNNHNQYFNRSAYIRGVQGGGINQYRLEFGTSNISTATTKMTLDFSGNLGIGTTSPTNAKVHIVGNGQYVGNYGYNTLTLEDASGYPGLNWRQGNYNWLVRKNGQTQELEFLYSSNASAPTTGTYTRWLRIEAGGMVETINYLKARGVRVGRDFSISNRATVRLDSNGVDAPADVLFGHTAAANQSSWTGVYWSLSSRGNSDGQKFHFYRGGGNPVGGSEAILMTLDPNLRVGINDTTPEKTLDVNGTFRATSEVDLARINFETGGYHGIRFRDDSGNNKFKWGHGKTVNEFYLYDYTKNGSIFTAKGNGDIYFTPTAQFGIKNTSPSYDLDVTGTIRASSDIIAFSDARVKENVKTIDNALDKVNKLRGVEYNKIGETEQKIGVIAQEIEQILPQVVQEDKDGMKSVAYGNIVGVLIEAIKEQQKQIDELKARLDA